jgi:hypothetical protein
MSISWLWWADDDDGGCTFNIDSFLNDTQLKQTIKILIEIKIMDRIVLSIKFDYRVIYFYVKTGGSGFQLFPITVRQYTHLLLRLNCLVLLQLE